MRLVTLPVVHAMEQVLVNVLTAPLITMNTVDIADMSVPMELIQIQLLGNV